MLLHEFGSPQGKTIVMLHGLAMRFDMLRPAIDCLAENHWRVFAVAVPNMAHGQYVITCPEQFVWDITSAAAQTSGASRGIPQEEQK